MTGFDNVTAPSGHAVKTLDVLFPLRHVSFSLGMVTFEVAFVECGRALGRDSLAECLSDIWYW